MQALEVGSIKNFEAFLWKGWDINEQIEMAGPTALGYAVHNKELLTWLLEHGADPNAGDEYDTPLSRAALGGDMEVVEMLLARGGDVHRGDVLNWAVERKDKACEVTRLLLKRGASPNRLRFDGVEPAWSLYGVKGLGSPLHRAIALRKLDVASVLLRHGADLKLQNTLGKTPRDIAEQLNDSAALDLLDWNDRRQFWGEAVHNAHQFFWM